MVFLKADINSSKYVPRCHKKNTGGRSSRFGIYAKEWFIDSLFYTEVDLDPLQDPKIVILKVEDSPRKYMINPQNRYDLVATKLAWLIVRVTSQKKLSHKNLNGIRLVSWLVIIILFFVAALFSAYEYLPR